MSGKTVHSAMWLLVLGNALAIGSDVFVKLLEPGSPVFQFAVFRVVFTVLLLTPFVLALSQGHLWRGLHVHAIRAHAQLGGIVCMVISLTYLPLATANAVFYAAPLLVLSLAWLVHRESLSWLSGVAVVSGFLGILVILRPVEFGRAAFGWAAVAALGAAMALAVNAILVRSLPSGQSMVQKLFINYLLIVPASVLFAWWERAPLDSGVLLSAAGSAVMILGYNVTVLLAYRTVAANQVTSAEYTGLIWAVAIGWLFFDEAPDIWFLVGSAMIVIPLLIIGARSRRRSRTIALLTARESTQLESEAPGIG